jgi:hypothetical protein
VSNVRNSNVNSLSYVIIKRHTKELSKSVILVTSVSGVQLPVFVTSDSMKTDILKLAESTYSERFCM